MKKVDRLIRLQGLLGKITTRVGAVLFLALIVMLLTVYVAYNYNFAMAPTITITFILIYVAFAGTNSSPVKFTVTEKTARIDYKTKASYVLKNILYMIWIPIGFMFYDKKNTVITTLLIVISGFIMIHAFNLSLLSALLWSVVLTYFLWAVRAAIFLLSA